ncbi:MAG TPA: nucleoside-diphosphate sugar epimerase/dehydratase [Longimicrobiales bacterium]|nr:nucleoside-diphosphate sugar epimerase/dehydratase [Longimicrobiales bacterium]
MNIRVRGGGELNSAANRNVGSRTAEGLQRVWAPAYALASRNRRLSTAFVYSVVAAASYCGAYLLRFEFAVPPEHRATLALTLPVMIALRLASSYVFGISSGRWRYVGTRDVLRLVVSTVAATAVLFVVTWGVPVSAPVPRSVLIIDLFLFTWLTAGVWISYRTGFEQFRALNGHSGELSRILIVGAGEAGSMLAREVTRSRFRRNAVGFVDDDPAKHHAKLHGLPVFGGVRDLQSIVTKHGIQEIVIAVPSATPRELRRIVEHCEATDLTFKVLPGLTDVYEGKVNWGQVRPLRVEDLLGRDPIALELPELIGDLKGRSVLITGAAGSIGSELTRQVALHRPGTLVLLDQSETGLFELSEQLTDLSPDVDIHFVVADIADEVAVEDVFCRFKPDRVFHAAAYKHVTMMQTNVRQALRNNVFGTMLVAAAAGRHRTEKFVFVSTDKAVSPTSIMGATKRLAEMLIMELQETYPATAFAAVRFGNVLGSNGSVIPIFRRQIESGQPLTVTHPDATRYFMMIPEAVQLVLQASLLPQVRGQIAMLDMGEPVRILDLARNLLRIAGLPHKNGNSVVFTGLRSGEKLHEELLAPGERTLPTTIEKVRIVVSDPTEHNSVVRLLGEWESAFRLGRPDDVLASLKALFPDLDGAEQQVELHEAV